MTIPLVVLVGVWVIGFLFGFFEPEIAVWFSAWRHTQ